MFYNTFRYGGSQGGESEIQDGILNVTGAWEICTQGESGGESEILE
jgi:hypothetical protein